MVSNFDIIEMGRRIKQCRSKLKMTQEDLGNALNYTRQKISSMEKGESEPTITDIYRMSKLFGCDVGYLMTEYDCKSRSTADVHQKTGLSEQAITELETRSVLYPDTLHGLNRIIEFNRGDIVDLLTSYLEFDFNQDVDTGTAVIKGQALENMYLMEICSELKAMKQKQYGGK